MGVSGAIELIAVAVLFLLLGRTWGSAQERRRSAAAQPTAADLLKLAAGADVGTDYAAGFRAGHLQGWRDAWAATEAEREPDAAAARESVSVGGEASWAERDRPGIPVAGPFRPPQPGPSSQTLQLPATNAAVPETAEEAAARKEKRDRQNINITLYIASLLIVAAGALFIGTTLPEGLRFVGVLAITALFYFGGLVLHARALRLRPAAVAFAGTGLALVPVAGLAMYDLAINDADVAWLITSLIGTVAYVVAAVRIESRVLVFLSLTFVVSTAWSGVSVLGGALVWYFAAMIGLAVLLTLLALWRPRWLPPVYLKPLMDLHPVLVPAVAIAVTFVPLLLKEGEYAFIMFLCGAYFSLVVLFPAARFRLAHFYGARVSLSIAAVSAVWESTDRIDSALLTAAGLAGVQAVVVAVAWGKLSGQLGGSLQRWVKDAVWTFAVQFFLTAVWVVISRFGVAGAGAEVPLWLPVLALLLTGMVLAIRFGGAVEYAPAGVLVFSLGFVDWLGEWRVAGLLALAVLFWSARGVPVDEPLRKHFVLAARISATVIIPVVTAAGVDSTTDRYGPVLFALSLALVGQQVVTAGLIRARVDALAPAATLVAFSAVGIATLVALSSADISQDSALTGGGILVQLLAGLSIGLLLFPLWAAQAARKPTPAELLPLGMAALLVALAFATVSSTIGNISLLLTTLYLAATAGRLVSLQRRWHYWWLTRGSGTLLILMAFHQVREETGPPMVGGEVVVTAFIAVAALAVQLVFPLTAAARGRAPRGVHVDVAVVLGIQLLSQVFVAPGRLDFLEADGWQFTVAAALTAAGAAICGYVLRSVPGSAKASSTLAPVAFAVLALTHWGDLPDVELILSIFAAFSAIMVLAVQSYTAKGVYFAAARVLTLVLVVVLTYDATSSAGAVFVALALMLAAQHVLRWLMRNKVREVPFQQAAVWFALGAQSILPLSYIARDSLPFVEVSDGGRWVVLLEFALLLVSAGVANRVFAARGAGYLAVYAIAFGTLALGPLLQLRADAVEPDSFLARPVLQHDGVVEVLLGLALAAAVAGVFFKRQGVLRKGSHVEDWPWPAGAGVFALTALAVTPLASDWLLPVSVLVASAVCFAASHVEELPLLYFPGAAAAVIGATKGAVEVFDQVQGAWGSYLPWLVGCFGASAALYAVRLLRRNQLADDPDRRRGLIGASVLGVTAAGVAGLRYDDTAWAGTLLVAVAAAVCAQEAPAVFRRLTAELGALALTAALQRTVLFVNVWRDWPDTGLSGWPFPDRFWVAQWYVVLAAALGTMRFISGDRTAGRLQLSIGAGLLSLSGLGILLSGNDAQQLWVLALFAVLLVAGLGYSERIFVWWGAGGVTLCLMWAMRQYTYALLALIAAALIVVAVWRLSRKRPETAEAARPVREPKHR